MIMTQFMISNQRDTMFVSGLVTLVSVNCISCWGKDVPTMFIFLLSILVILLALIHLGFNYNENARLIRKIPGPHDAFIVGNALEVLVSPVQLMKLGRVYTKKWKNIHRFWSFPFAAVMIYNPQDIEVIISSARHNDKSKIYLFLKPWLRNGLLVSNGEKWQQRRKLLTPAFHFNILRQFYLVIEENTQRLVEALGKVSGEAVDIVPILSEYTLNSICETAMGTQLNQEGTGEGRSYKLSIYALGQLFVERFTRIYLYPDLLFNWSTFGRQMHKHLKSVHSFTQRVIRDRRDYVTQHGIKTAEVKDDEEIIYKKRKKTAMLDLLLLAEKDGLIDSIGIQEEVDTFMFEGHDTTASGLTFFLMELANNKDIQDKIHKELKHIFGDSKRSASMADLSKMSYLECCIKESLRLYPPVHFISRQLKEKTVLSGYTIPANTLCHISILDLHRSPFLYKDPLKFDPDRFLPENSVGRHAYAYIPFSAGPRNCIGQKFAIMEMKSAIAEILREFEILPVTRPEELVFTADLVLRNAGPVYVLFAKR